MCPPRDSQSVPVFSPSLPEPGCQLFPALGSATPGHPHSWATWNPASRPVSSEPSRPPRLASYACSRSGSMRHCCPHLVLDVTQAPGPVCTLPDTLRTPRTAGGLSISIPPEVLGFIYPIQSRLINLSPHASCSVSPGSWPRHLLRVTHAGSSHGLCHATGSPPATVRHHVSNTLQGFFWYLSCRGRHTCHL